MKKRMKLCEPALLRRILQSAAIKLCVALAAMLIWDRLMNQNGYRSLVGYAFPVAGIILLAMAWFNHLCLDGFLPALGSGKPPQEKKNRHRINSMIDYTDEEPESQDSFDADQQRYCNLASNLMSGAVLFIPGLCAMLF